MPQLDKVTYLSQFFWLAYFYILFYYFMLKCFLPRLTRTFKLRKKKMSLSQNGAEFLFEENGKVKNNSDSLISKGLCLSRTHIHKYYQRSLARLYNIQFCANVITYRNVNSRYIEFVGNSSLNEDLTLDQASLNTTEIAFISKLLSIIR